MMHSITPVVAARDLIQALWEAAERAKKQHKPYEVSQLGNT